MGDRKIRILVAKIGLDRDAREARLIARGLRNEGGMEVIYTGLYQTIEEVVESAVQEDIDIIMLSAYSGSHMTVFPQLREALDRKGAEDILLIGEGLIPDMHIKELKESGAVREIFKTGTSIKVIIEWINKALVDKWNEEGN